MVIFFITSFCLLLPLFKLFLAFLAFKEGEDVREQCFGEPFDDIIGNGAFFVCIGEDIPQGFFDLLDPNLFSLGDRFAFIVCLKRISPHLQSFGRTFGYRFKNQMPMFRYPAKATQTAYGICKYAAAG